MTDLTVLVSPIPLYPPTTDFTFGRKRRTLPHARPIMVTLETDLPPSTQQSEGGSPNASPEPLADPDFIQPPTPSSRRSRSPRVPIDHNLLSPPPNTWKSRPQWRPRHRPTRSQSAPPERRIPLVVFDETVGTETEEEKERQRRIHAGPLSAVDPPSVALQRSQTTRSSFNLSTSSRSFEILPPPPPLLRPTTFWRKTKRSGVTSASYSPSSHLIRRSTYIAAGLTFDSPVHDLSALCVESRVGFIVIPPEETF